MRSVISVLQGTGDTERTPYFHCPGLAGSRPMGSVSTLKGHRLKAIDYFFLLAYDILLSLIPQLPDELAEEN